MPTSLPLNGQVQWRRHIETMSAMTIQIPDDLARGLEGIAAAEQKSVQQLAVERLRSLLDKSTSPGSLLRTIRALPHPSPAAVDDLDDAIAATRLPVSNLGVFDR
jgi:hypothetical protein